MTHGRPDEEEGDLLKPRSLVSKKTGKGFPLPVSYDVKPKVLGYSLAQRLVRLFMPVCGVVTLVNLRVVGV
jgi:hypothetical protein